MANIQNRLREQVTVRGLASPFGALANDALCEIDRLTEQAAALKKDAAKSERRAVEFGSALQNFALAMQAAILDAGWIYNTLCGPGLLPDFAAAKAMGGAQAWFDAKTAEEDARVAALSAPPQESFEDVVVRSNV